MISDPAVCEAILRAEQNQMPIAYAMEKGKVQITNMEIKGQNAQSLWPQTRMSLKAGEFVHMVKVTGASWVPTTMIAIKENGSDARRQFASKPNTDLVRFPIDEGTRKPHFWAFHGITNEGKSKGDDHDGFVTIEAGADSQPLSPVLTRAPHGDYDAFAITPPILMDGNNDGKFELNLSPEKKAEEPTPAPQGARGEAAGSKTP